MKRFLLLTTCLLTLFSCSNDLEFNEHAFQVIKDGKFWQATEFGVSINEDGFLSIVGVLNDETITLNLASSGPGVHDLTAGSNSTAWFRDKNGKGFTSEYLGDGEVIIENYDPLEQTYNGRFRFNAFSSDGEIVNFTKGVFYRVPMVSEVENDPLSRIRSSVDDSEFVAEEVLATKREGNLEVEAFAEDGSFIKLIIPEDITPGSFNLNEQSDSGTHAIYGYANGTTSNAQFGTLFINEHDITTRMIKGTFVFTTLLPNSVSVDNGSFNVYY